MYPFKSSFYLIFMLLLKCIALGQQHFDLKTYFNKDKYYILLYKNIFIGCKI